MAALGKKLADQLKSKEFRQYLMRYVNKYIKKHKIEVIFT